MDIKASNNEKGHHFCVPPTVHAEKGEYRYVPEFDPALIIELDDEECTKAAEDAVAAGLIARHLPPVGRHHLSLALAGFLLRNGLDQERVQRVLEAAWRYHAAPSDAFYALTRNVADTAEKLKRGEPTTGGRTLEGLISGLPKSLASAFGLRSHNLFEGADFNEGEGEDKDLNQQAMLSASNVDLLCTDTANAQRFARRFKGEVIYVPRFGWMAWDGYRYKRDHAGMAIELAKTVSKIVLREGEKALSEGRKDDAKALLSWSIVSLSRSRIEALLALARSIPKLVVEHQQLDSDPKLFNCLSGTVDLRTGEKKPHDKADLLTRLAPVEYDAGMETAYFDAFLEKILPTEALRGFVQRLFGLYLSGSAAEQILVIFHGVGSNGKSTLINVIMDILGIEEDGYGYQAPHDFLMVKHQQVHPTEKASLFKKRFVAAVETDRGIRLSESLVKSLTGGESITARFMRQDFFTFKPTHKTLLATNHKPEIQGTDHAIWRRVKLVPFDVIIPEEDQDKELPQKLQRELPGILAWCVKGFLDWQEYGLGEPDAVRQATQEYRDEEDRVGDFVAEECVLDRHAEVQAGVLWKAYERWCERNGDVPVGQKAFGGSIVERGFQRVRETAGPNRGRKKYLGIGLVYRGDPDGSGERSSEHDGEAVNRGADGSPQESPANDHNSEAPVNGVNHSDPIFGISSDFRAYGGPTLKNGSPRFTNSMHSEESPANGQVFAGEPLPPDGSPGEPSGAKTYAGSDTRTAKAIEALTYGYAPKKALEHYHADNQTLDTVTHSVMLYSGRRNDDFEPWRAATEAAIYVIDAGETL